MSDKSWEPGSFLMFSYVFQCYLLSFSLSHSLTLFLTLTLTLDMLNNFCFHLYAQKSLSHSHTLTLTHSLTLSLSHSFNLSFNHSRHAEQVLYSSVCPKVAVYRRKLQCFFLTSSSSPPSPVSFEFIELVPS